MYEIYAYQNSASLFGIFNAVAAMLGAESYVASLAAAAFCGFFASAIAYCFAPEKLHGWKWIGTVVLVYSVLLVPKVTVGIVDKTGGGPEQIVSNVPFGMAFFGSLTSTVGNSLTDVFETAFQALPGPAGQSPQLSYQQGGLAFGNRLVRATSGSSFTDPALRTDVINFILNCTMYDLADGTLDPKLFSISDDIWGLMNSPNPARFTPVAAPTGSVLTTCPVAYTSINGRLPVQINTIQALLAGKLNPTMPAAMAVSAIAGQIEQAYIRDQISASSIAAADIIRQNAFINALNDASKIQGQRSNDPTSLLAGLARAQATAQQNAAWINGAKLAEEALPIVRNSIEAVTYAVFPLVVLLLLLTNGRETWMALKGYLGVLIWIQLWPPLYAILNYMASIYFQFDISAAANVGGGVKALALQTASSIYSSAVSGEAVVGSLVISIPIIAWQAMRRFESFGSSVTEGLRSLQQKVDSDTSSAVSGNTQLGVLSMDQHTISPSASSAWVSRNQNVNGDWFTHDGLGRLAVEKLQNKGFAEHTVSLRTTQEHVDAASRSAEAAQSEAISAVSQQGAVLAEAFTRASRSAVGMRDSTGVSTSNSEESGKDLAIINSGIESIQNSLKVDQQQAANIFFSTGLRGSVYGNYELKARAGTPSWLPAGIEASGTAGGGITFDTGAGMNRNYGSSLASSDQHTRGNITSEQLSAVKRFQDRLSHDSNYVRTISGDDATARDVSSRLSTSSSRAQQAEARFAERFGRAEEIRKSYQQGEALQVNLAADPRFQGFHEQISEQIRLHGGKESQALAVWFSSELARRGIKNNQFFDDGSAVPTSFTSVREQYRLESNDPRYTANGVTDAKAAADAKVKRSDLPPVPVERSAPLHPSGIRQEVESAGSFDAGGAGLLHDRPNAAEFERNHKITHGTSGQIGTKESLLAGTAAQVVDDAKNTIDSGIELGDRPLMFSTKPKIPPRSP